MAIEMKIAMMSAWNEDSGASTHAELIGREWEKIGHDLKVFSFFTHDFDGTPIVGKDEDYVIRCFTTSTYEYPYLDPRPILEADFDNFVAQDLGMLPKDCLGKIFHHIQKKSCTLTVIHDNGPSIEEKRAGMLSRLLELGTYVKPMDQMHAQLAIGPQVMNLQSSLTEGIFKTEKTKGIELQQGTDSR